MAASIYFESSEAAAAVDKWHPIDVVEAAKFAVKVHNKSKKTHLKFQKVIKGQRLMNSDGEILRRKYCFFLSLLKIATNRTNCEAYGDETLRNDRKPIHG